MSSDIRQVINEQNRRRRLYFWAGFLAIALFGSLWAGLSKDPRGPGFFGEDVMVDADVVEQPAFIETTTIPAPAFTTETIAPFATETTGPFATETTGPPTTAPDTTQGSTTASTGPDDQ
jgi:hypothetical protein